ncbi:type III-B CRISPR module RAMP protein Cmr4 [uncultured Thiodictyon sp.]|uniref:type III-B CRISPR module RAMP protein Cmr4 n=1 Tax=uncultured Thiodictyon sp. TaxID=1846217 RepID=UPI0025EA2363|nr:type III-B CRISPR module RAMP protein Cmr4 [uncultured Thiodictyon sp.]
MQRAYFIHALSPLHPGTGQAQGAIDLPIARLRGTGIPYLPGSSVKGVLRDAYREEGLHNAVFGPPVKLGQEDTRFSGALAFGDARLLALPVRSFHGTFAWVTSPLLLRLARRDLEWSHQIPGAYSVKGKGWIGVTQSTVLAANGHVFLEDLECPMNEKEQDLVSLWAKSLGQLVLKEDVEIFTERFAVVDDETMTFLWEHSTQVDARVRINEQGVVQDGALWYEESLPAETLLLGVAAVIKSGERPDQWLDYCLGEERANLQFGGKATVGRGRARLVPVTGERR